MIKVGIIGATGYTGAELLRILVNHAQVEITALTTTSQAGKSITEIYPSLTGYVNNILVEDDIEKTVSQCDVVFVALPHGNAVKVAKEVVKQGKVMIDLGADLRLKDADVYEKWYKVNHDGRDILEQAVYAIPELYREDIKGKKLIANPGCYPTSVLLALVPLLRAGAIEHKSIIIDSKSGMSGAGRSLSEAAHYCTVNENIDAYGVATHRHTPEIEQELTKACGEDVLVSFTPHHMPITRGILSTIYADLKDGFGDSEIKEIYKMYDKEKFVHLLDDGVMPHTKWVYGSNNCHINYKIDKRTNRIIVVSAIDNLVKGASGQAVQNMNIAFGLNECTGLNLTALVP